MSATNRSAGGKRLDSWKEIAAFFDRDERTVNRWEKELGLPVHRLPGTKGRVYAYTEELSGWLAAPNNGGADLPGHDHVDGRGLGSSSLTVTGGERATAHAGALENPPQEVTTLSPVRYGNPIRLLAIAMLVLVAIALFPFHTGASRGPKRAGQAASSGQQGSRHGVVLASTPAHNPEAEQFYLQGRYYWNKRTPEDLNKALDYFMQAVVHDPGYAPAYVGLADSYNLLREYTLMPSSEAYPRALAAAKKAVELDDQSSEAHASLAFVSFFGMWDVTTGEREFRRAIDLDPNNPAPHQWYANALMALHRLPEALAEIDRAQALDPSSGAILADKGNILQAAGRRDEALSLLKQMENRDPSFRSVHLYLKYLYLRSQDYPDYISESRNDAVLVHDESALAVATAAEKGYAAGGSRGMFEAMLQVQKKLYAQHSVPPTTLALTFALLGNKSEALRYLKAGYEQRDGSELFVGAYPEFNCLHHEPAYRELLARMNLPAQNTQ
jgi:tetratricopeptide (TPR) repeat protein